MQKDDVIYRQDAIDTVMKHGKRIPTYAIMCKDALEKLPSAELELDPCDFCKHNDDCGYMLAYCPAERKEE